LDGLVVGIEVIGAFAVGDGLGPWDGALDGLVVGPCDGALEGPAVGPIVGEVVGPCDGDLEGPAVGPFVGDAVGPEVAEHDPNVVASDPSNSPPLATDSPLEVTS